MIDAAKVDGVDVQDLDGFFSGAPLYMSTGSAELIALARLHDELDDDGTGWVSFSTLADLVQGLEMTDRWVSPTWSDQVKNGQ